MTFSLSSSLEEGLFLDELIEDLEARRGERDGCQLLLGIGARLLDLLVDELIDLRDRYRRTVDGRRNVVAARRAARRIPARGEGDARREKRRQSGEGEDISKQNAAPSTR